MKDNIISKYGFHNIYFVQTSYSQTSIIIKYSIIDTVRFNFNTLWGGKYWELF